LRDLLNSVAYELDVFVWKILPQFGEGIEWKTFQCFESGYGNIKIIMIAEHHGNSFWSSCDVTNPGIIKGAG
jgi:hypothetical protein